MAPNRRITQKQEKFCLKYFEFGNATKAAIEAGYKPVNARTVGSENLTKPLVKARIAELRKVAEDASVMSVLERKQKLTEIARAKMLDFIEVEPDGSLTVNLKSGNGAAIYEAIIEDSKSPANAPIKSRTSKIKLINPIEAIQELNKMEKVYTEGATVNVDNRKVEIIVAGDNARRLTEQILDGKGTAKCAD